jgi:hypothetical protein
MEASRARESALRWAASVALMLPVIVLYAAEYLRGDGFTGFIQYDQPSYMADARKYFDGGFHLFYGNPFSPNPDTPAIYFQIHLFVLGLIEKVTGWDPGAVYVLFGFAAALACIRVAMALYEEVAGLRTTAERIGLVLFIWGGGMLALMGLAYHAIPGHGGLVSDLFRFDPDGGWWFLNLGRNLVFPTEAYYHALALGAILTAMRRNFRGTLALGFLLLLSHPFTGLQFLLILGVWAVGESLVLRNRAVPFLFAGTITFLLFLHLFYYVVLLNLFPEHRALFAQWSLAWNEPAVTALGADILVGLPAIWAVRNGKLARDVLSHPAKRLIVTWFVIALLLAHHDLLFRPRQPLHFTHGYTWIALFLLGAGPLVRLIESALGRKRALFRACAVGLILAVGFSDNLAWFGLQIAGALTPRWGAMSLPDDAFVTDPSEREVFRWLMQRPEPHTELLVATDPDSTVPYLATVYTDYRGWYTHLASTPLAAQRRQEVFDYVRTGTIAPGWKGRSLLLIASRSAADRPADVSRWGAVLFENKAYRIFRVDIR